MGQEIRLKIAGLHTHPSDLSEVPEGALIRAKNTVIDEDSIIEPRRGVPRYSYAFSGTSGDRAEQIFEYDDTILVHRDDDVLCRDNGSTAFVDYSGTVEPPDSSTKIKSAKAAGNFYFTSSKGIRKLDSVTGSLLNAGVSKGITFEITDASDASGIYDFDAGLRRAAYRVVWGYKDANDNLILGAPSERRDYTSGTTAGNSDNAQLDITIPDDATTSWLYQVYRTDIVDASVEPGDEMGLVYEANPTSGQITAGTLSFDDVTPDAVKGATLYTSPSQETIANANETPPFAKDIALFKNRLWFANVKSKHRLQVSLVGVPANNDTIEINGVTYTFKTSASTATEVQIGTGSTAQIIGETARDLCKTVNQYSSNTTIYAYYLSGADDTPGIMLFERRDLSDTSFDITTSVAGDWQPQGLSGGVTSQNDEFQNGLMFTKNQEYEAVPSKNLFRIGSQNDAIKRILPLRDSLFVLTDGGVYRITGEDEGSFRVDLFDATVRIIGRETAKTLNNAIYFLSDQGVVQLTETGASVISRPIEGDLLEVVGTIKDDVEAFAFGIGYESERKYILGMPQLASDDAATKYHVYNTFTRAWTEWEDIDGLCGFVNPADDKLYLGDSGSNFLLQERKAFDFSDYVDYRKSVTISSISSDGLTLTFTSGGSANIAKGDVIYQADDSFGVVGSVDTNSNQATLIFDGNLSASTATVYARIETIIEWAPFTGKNPGISKQFQDIALIFRENFRVDATLSFATDQSQDSESVTFTAQGFGHWGAFPWGGVAWGGESGREPVRTWPPLEKARATQMNITFTSAIGFTSYKLNGASVVYEEMSERFRR